MTEKDWIWSNTGSWVPPEGEVSSRSHLAKACGQMTYVSDMTLPGMLIGRALRSPYPHCTVNEINIEPALRIPGVHAVLTAKDIPGENSIGKTVVDQQFLASDRARTVLDALAIVAAETDEIAQSALNAIELDLTPLPAVFTPEEALHPDAPQLYPDGNLVMDFKIIHGDAARAMLDADIVVENSYQFPWIEHAFIETESTLAAPSDDDTITIWLGVHNIYGERQMLARSFGWPEERFRIILVPAGGAFGGKDDNVIPTWAALLAHHTGRPVRFVLSRQDSIRGHSKRHPQQINHRLGARSDGMIVAAEVEILGDTGAYAHWGEGVLTFASLQSTGPYKVPNAHVHTQMVYTNNTVAGAMRGWGTPGVEFAAETQMNLLAGKLGMHPLQLRWLNALQDNDITISGAPVPSGCRVKQTILEAAKEIGLTLENGRIP